MRFSLADKLLFRLAMLSCGGFCLLYKYMYVMYV